MSLDPFLLHARKNVVCPRFCVPGFRSVIALVGCIDYNAVVAINVKEPTWRR